WRRSKRPACWQPSTPLSRSRGRGGSSRVHPFPAQSVPAFTFKEFPMRIVFLSVLIASTAACTWVPIESGGKAVRVLPAGPVAPGCVAKGEIVVSVKEIGRASCRERVEISGGAVSVEEQDGET